MNNPENEKTCEMNESFHPGQEPDPMQPAINSPPPMYETAPSMPYQYQPYTGPPMHGTAPSMPYQYHPYTGPPAVVAMQPQQTIFVRNVQPVQPVNEPAHLTYSIFTLLCCCLPLGIAGLIYSIKTQGANQRGDITSAKKYSRVARTLDNMALGFGITSIILGCIVVIVSRVLAEKALQQTSFGNYNP